MRHESEDLRENVTTAVPGWLLLSAFAVRLNSIKTTDAHRVQMLSVAGRVSGKTSNTDWQQRQCGCCWFSGDFQTTSSRFSAAKSTAAAVYRKRKHDNVLSAVLFSASTRVITEHSNVLFVANYVIVFHRIYSLYSPYSLSINSTFPASYFPFPPYRIVSWYSKREEKLTIQIKC